MEEEEDDLEKKDEKRPHRLPSRYESDEYSRRFIIIITAFLVLFSLIYLSLHTIDKHYELEQKKLDLMRYQFDLQIDQENHKLELQAAQERVKAFGILMNSSLVTTAANLLGTPNSAGNKAADLVEELIKRLNIDVNLNAQVGNNEGANPINASNKPNDISNTLTNTLQIKNNRTSVFLVKTVNNNTSIFLVTVLEPHE